MMLSFTDQTLYAILNLTLVVECLSLSAINFLKHLLQLSLAVYSYLQ